MHRGFLGWLGAPGLWEPGEQGFHPALCKPVLHNGELCVQNASARSPEKHGLPQTSRALQSRTSYQRLPGKIYQPSHSHGREGLEVCLLRDFLPPRQDLLLGVLWGLAFILDILFSHVNMQLLQSSSLTPPQNLDKLSTSVTQANILQCCGLEDSPIFSKCS